jgi:2-iminobutanoate/2-iminopropanoate deaminase
MTFFKTMTLAASMLAATGASAQGIERKYASPTSVIASSVSVPADARLVFLSGATASPIDPAKPDEMGDTKAQTLSVLTKMKANLESMGMTMGDVVKINVFLVAPTPGGRMDSAAMNEVFKTFFGTPEQPNKPARSTVQVAALGRPTTYVEIEGIAVKPGK